MHPIQGTGCAEAMAGARREMQPQGVEQSGDLARMGLKVEWDAETNKPVIKPLV